MAVTHGKNGKIKLGSNVVAEITNYSYDESVETADSTSMGDAAMTHTSGIPGWNASVECFYDPTDTDGQVALSIGASVSPEFYPEGDASGKTYRSGTATVTALSTRTEVNGNIRLSMTLQGNGALSTATAS